MAIFDPPDGSIDSRPRCMGNCCKGFSLEYPFSTVEAEFQKKQIERGYQSFIPDLDTIYPMLIPLGVFRKQELFTCKHLGKNGDCGIYEVRPKMCRDFPGPNPCPYRNCASHGPQPVWKRAWNWLRD
jgi:Fe-S-cluster containining protein